MSNVTPLRPADTPESLLEAAKKWDGGLQEVIVVGINSDGDVVSGSTMDSTGDVLMALSIASKHMVEICDEMGFKVEAADD